MKITYKQYCFDVLFPILAMLINLVMYKVTDSGLMLGFFGTLIMYIVYTIGQYVGETRKQRKP